MDRRLVHIVDDEPAVRRAIAFMLKTSGFAVELWTSGVEFLNQLRHIPMGCILLDVRMPQLDGLGVQQALVDRGVDMPVILMTGHGDTESALRGMRLGAIDFIDKPFEKSVILAAIRNAFDWHDAKADGAVQRARAASAVGDLAAQEMEILIRLTQGMAVRAIADDLGQSVRSVEQNRAALMEKLGVHRHAELLRVAFAAGVGI